MEEIFNKNSEIIIYPYSKDGKSIANIFISRGYNVVEFWNDYEYDFEYNGIEVKKPYMNCSKIVVVCSRIAIEESLIKKTKELKCRYVYIGNDLIQKMDLSYEEKCENYNLLCEKNIRKILKMKKNINFDFEYVLQITEKCSLRCRDCIALMPYFSEPKDMDFQNDEKIINKFLDSIDYVHRFTVIGGEPFLCKYLYKYVNILKKSNKISVIEIVTNGTILPQGENLECLKDDKIFVEISNYGEISKKIYDIEEKFKKEKIYYRIVSHEKWTKCSVKKHNRLHEDLKLFCQNCVALKSCKTIKDGRLFPCTFLANAASLKIIPDINKYSIDILKIDKNELSDKIKIFKERDFFEACDYCNGFHYDKLDEVKAAIQVKRNIKLEPCE